MGTDSITEEQWEQAIDHARTIRDRYEEIGANGIPALQMTIRPAIDRYNRGERTEDLYEKLMSLE